MSTKNRIVSATTAHTVQNSKQYIVKARNGKFQKGAKTTHVEKPASPSKRKTHGSRIGAVPPVENLRGPSKRQLKVAAPTQLSAAPRSTIDAAASQLLSLIPGLTSQQAQHFLQGLVNTRLSVQALGPALTKLETAATPSTARALQATENVWRELDERYRLLSSTEVATLLGAKGANRAYAANLRAKGHLLGIQRRNSYVYPGFQFNARNPRIKPAIPLLLALAAEVTWDLEDLTIWLSTPSGYFGGDRPADHLDETETLLSRARDEATVQW
ncbi:hypothetical protein [Cryobacterium melibiosiphilum]|uniref:hypothetical protein n=1 Tax=Cryobacterium melibiosiphilum TaxID=995039 RepID=UPI0011C22256|nr:hypothetical protein [Cryobacterium melibiosiphilum]